MTGTDVDAIRAALAEINAAWREQRYDDLERHFHPGIIFVPPGFGPQERGLAACIETYRHFGSIARLLEYEASEALVDVWGDTAVAQYGFRIRYQIEGRTHDDCGADVFVFNRSGGQWVAVWRTITAEPDRTGKGKG
jgi:ketosteroid isomerase-like protein